MTIPLWVLLGFALWTLAILMVGIGISRWSLILTGAAQLTDFPGDRPHGGAAYRRAVRAHANCVENLPVFGAIVLVLYAVHLDSRLIDTLAVALLVARVCQSTVHMAFAETNTTVLVRFSFFSVQLVAMLWLALEIVRAGGPPL